jgi:uncharacterized protein YecA (UPF0149 family)
MKNLVQFKNFIEPLIEEFEQSNYFQQLNVETQKNANLFVTSFVKHAENIFSYPNDMDEWDDCISVNNVYTIFIFAFDWKKVFPKNEGELTKDNFFIFPQVEDAKNTIVAFFQFLTEEKELLFNSSEIIEMLNEKYEKYESSVKEKQMIFMMNDMHCKAIKERINIYDQDVMNKFADKEVKKMQTMNKYDTLAAKFGENMALDKMSLDEQQIVMSCIMEENDITDKNVDIALGKKLQAQITSMYARGASDAKVEQFTSNLSEIEVNSLFYVSQEEMKNNAQRNSRPVTVGPKIGRNDPCSCGSGKKYKKCCG